MATRTELVTNGNNPNNSAPDDKNKRLAYNMYRGMLTQFYPQANAIIEALPQERVTYDQGVDRQIIEMVQQSNKISGAPKRGSNMSGGMGDGPGMPPPPPPPPPPPMPGPGSAGRGRPQPSSSLEPPAAIQMAMMMGQSKDKKPFTYTPGGIDLSQIKSPRMARRICRNAANEGVAGPPPTPPTPPTNGQQFMPPSAGPVYPPQVAVPVLPPPPPMPPNLIQRPPPSPQQMRPPVLPPQSPQQQVPPPPPPQQMPSQQMRPPMPPPQAGPPQRPLALADVLMGSLPQQPSSPQPQQFQQRGPAPMRPVEVVRASPTQPPSPQFMAPQSPMSPDPQFKQVRTEPVRAAHPSPTQHQQAPPGSVYIPVVMQQSPQPQIQPASVMLNKTQGMPWMNSATQQQPPQSPTPSVWNQPACSSPGTRVIPIHVEGRNSPLNVAPQMRQQIQQGGPGVKMIPIQIEGRPPSTPPAGPGAASGWNSPGPDNPTQSRSFRVLQRITSYDEIEGEHQSAPVSHSGPPPPAPMQQMRKMQLSNDDRALMERFKAQVDEDSSLHTEADPRYRGAAIPSRAFKMLQTMTGPDGMESQQAQAHRAPAQQQRVTTELYVPPSEQSAQPEPRKYTGSAIPSRSFRMLQAMTGTNQDENGLAYSEVPAEAMYYPNQSPCPSPYSWYYPSEGGSGDPNWDSYVYAYYQNYGQFPPNYYYPNGYESEEFSGYSSTEEMGYYDPQQAAAYYAGQPCLQDSQTESENPPETTTDANSSDESEDSETEVEDSEEDEEVEPKRTSSGAIQAIKSVSDVRIMTVDEDESEPEEEPSQQDCQLGLKQLSVIYEESEHSDAESVRRWKSRPAVCAETEESSDAETEDEYHTSAKEEEDDESTEEESDSDEVQNSRATIKPSRSRATPFHAKVESDSDENESTEEEEENVIEVIKQPVAVAAEVEEAEESEEEEDEEDEPVLLPKKPEVVSIVKEEEESEEEEDSEDEEEEEEISVKSPTVASQPPIISAMPKTVASKPPMAPKKNAPAAQMSKPEVIKAPTSQSEEDEDESSDEACDRKIRNSSTVVEISKPDSPVTKKEDTDSEEEEESEDETNATVTVRLPLRIKISPSSTNCGPVATLTVGNSEQVQEVSSEQKSTAKVEEWMQRGEATNQRSSPEVSICLSLPLRTKPAPPPENEDSHWEDDSSSTSIQTVRHRRASVASSIHSVATSRHVYTPPVDSDKEKSDDYELGSPVPVKNPVIIEDPAQTQPALADKPEKPKRTTAACEKRLKRNKRRSSTEDDSGVTDLSRQISDSESEVGLDLMLACQRAATHSRLFKLLQDAGVCSDEDEEDEGSSDNQQKETQDIIVPVTKPEVKPKRDTLRLPLQVELNDSSSLSSSEITSPASPTVAAKLVRELAKELSKKKGKKSKSSRIHATALRIMKEEDNDPYDTGTTGSSASSDSGGARPSPLHPHQPPQMPQCYPAYPPHMYGPHYYDYVEYYNSWGMMDPRDYASIPARAYRVLTQPGVRDTSQICNSQYDGARI